MANPKMVIHMAGGLIQDITVSDHMTILVIDSDVCEEPGKDNDVVKFSDGERVAFIYPANVSAAETAALFDRTGNAMLMKFGLLQPGEAEY